MKNLTPETERPAATEPTASHQRGANSPWPRKTEAANNTDRSGGTTGAAKSPNRRPAGNRGVLPKEGARRPSLQDPAKINLIA